MTDPITLVLEGVLPPEREWKYTYLPFEVPAGIERIDVTYTYEAAISSDPQLQGGNTIDIGIFDMRGIEFHSPGYRGWSGSARKSFFIAQEEATPGYMPGPIQPGTWNIILGPYKVAPQGCHYHVDITLTPTAHPIAAFPALLRLSNAPSAKVNTDGWYKGDIHCHTVNSDGDSTPEIIVRLAESLGFDFLAVTDHNNRTQGIDLATIHTDLMLIPGCEVTTYYGHWNIWGDGGWIDFRVESADDLAGFIQQANAQDYLVSCNHPRPYGPDWAFPKVAGFQCVEVWNGPWELLNSICVEFWEEKLRKGERLTAVGGSDHHFTRQDHIARLGHPTLHIYCEGQPSPAKLLQSLRDGHAFVTDSPTGARLTFSAGAAMMGDTVPRPAAGSLSVSIGVRDGEDTRLQVIGAAGVLAEADVALANDSFDFTLDVSQTPYVRAQLIDLAEGDNTGALTNPIYLR
jgi:hypothetical protein